MGKFLKFMLIALILEWSGSQCAKMKVGSLDEKPADEKTTMLIHQVQSNVSSYGVSISQKKALTPISYKTQAVAGTIYFIKAEAEGKCVVLRVYEKLPHMIQNGEEAVSLGGIRKINSCEDEIQYFEPESIQNAKQEVGLSDEKSADKEIKDVVKQVQSQMSSYGLSNSRNNPIEPISYRMQVVAGRIYFVKAQQKADGTCVFLRISKKLPHMVKKGDKAVSLTGIKKINSCKDDIEYFEPSESKKLKGAPSDEKPADKRINQIVQKVQSQMSSYDISASTDNLLKPISYKKVKKQAVAESIYFVKAQFNSGGKCVLLRIYEKLPYSAAATLCDPRNKAGKKLRKSENWWIVCAPLVREPSEPPVAADLHPYMVKQGKEVVSLDGIKNMNSCGDKIEYFEPQSTTKKPRKG